MKKGRDFYIWATQREDWAALFMLLATGCFVLGAGIFGMQALYWLQFGGWPAVTAESMLAAAELARPRVSWVGVQKIVDAALGLPLGLDAFVLGTALIWLGLSVADR